MMSEHVPTETRECGCTVPETLYCAHDNREAMMSDHIEAMNRQMQALMPVDWEREPWPEAFVHLVWAAGIEALIAHKPCGGTGQLPLCDWAPSCGLEAGHEPPHRSGYGPEDAERFRGKCPGPHTVIDKGDGTKLYARRLPWVYDGEVTLRVPLPSEWRIE